MTYSSEACSTVKSWLPPARHPTAHRAFRKHELTAQVAAVIQEGLNGRPGIATVIGKHLFKLVPNLFLFRFFRLQRHGFSFMPRHVLNLWKTCG
jgi:hypothetical protein